MKRYITENLLKWKNKPNRKPLILQGARQVGKTWIMKDFAKKYYKKFVYINFEINTKLQEIFSQDLDIARIIASFEIEASQNIDNNTLIILDEIQEAVNGLTALKYFYENAPEFQIMAAGSFLGVSLQKNKTFPVGKVDFLTLYPLNFEEFLLNLGEEILLKHLLEKNWDILAPFHEKLIQLLRVYYFVGGMPEVMSHYIENKDFKEARNIQQNILLGYENDFAKYAPIEIVPKIRMVWQSIIGQLSKENKKFIYNQLKEGARAKEFESAINWLVNSGLVHKSFLVAKPAIPLSAYSNFDAFKLFLVDIGLLNAMAKIDEKILLEKNKILTEYKGAMTEQFVCQELKHDFDLYYWSAKNGTAELDFLIQKNDLIIPIEVKAEENLKAKSLKIFAEKFNPKYAIRTTMNPYRNDEWLINIPLYGIGNI